MLCKLACKEELYSLIFEKLDKCPYPVSAWVKKPKFLINYLALIIISQIFTAFKHYLLDRKDSPGEKTILNPQALACFENSPKFPSSCPSILYPKYVSILGRQVDLTFFCSREHLLGMHWMLVYLKWGRTDECLELKHMKRICRLIYWREILYFKYDFVSQIRTFSMRLGPKQQKLKRNLTINPTSAKCSYW